LNIFIRQTSINKTTSSFTRSRWLSGRTFEWERSGQVKDWKIETCYFPG